MRCQKKKTRLQFFVSGSAIESASKHTYWLHADSIWRPETKKCSRVIFCYAALILMTNSNFQTPLTLNSHKSCLKNYRIKNYQIFGISRTSAFIWQPWIHLENFCIGVIGKNAKKYRFAYFPCPDGEKK